MRDRLRRCVFLSIFMVFMTFHAASAAYGASLEELFQRAKEQEAGVTGERPDQIPDSRFLAESRVQNDIRILFAAGKCVAAGQEQVFYAVGKNYVPEGSMIPVLFGNQAEYSSTAEDRIRQGEDIYTLVRFAVRPVRQESPEKPDFKETKEYWNLGDTVLREIGGQPCRFRCIDQDYQGNALFLCDSVIPADFGSRYVYETAEDGTHEYVYCPGPVEKFGESSEYRESWVRRWLKEQEKKLPPSPAVNVGVTKSFMGRSEKGEEEQFDEGAFASFELGSQRLTDRLFILSLDEAFLYRDYLWKVPDLPASAFTRGYWLRSPMAGAGGGDTGYVYMVDLTEGSIHPHPAESPAGIRPAFVLPQKNK